MKKKDEEVTNAEEVKKISRDYAPEVIRSMVEIAINKKYPASTRVQAGQVVLSRAYGKPDESIKVKNDGGGSFISVLRKIESSKTVTKEIKEDQPDLEMPM